MFEILKEKIKLIQKEINNNIVIEKKEKQIKDIKLPSISYPIICDDVISLTSYTDNINGLTEHKFDIILNQTGEKIGYIAYDYTCNVKSKNSCGNVFYGIKKDYQNKGYATRALKLLKEVVKNNELKCNKNLYFWVAYYNEASKKVVLNNGGEIIKEGKPITDKAISKPYMLKIKI